MMKLTFLPSVMLLISQVLWAGELAGKADFVSGTISVIQDDGSRYLLKAGDAVNTGDTLVSGANSEAHLHMTDEAYLALRANSRVVIKSYQAQNKESDNSVLELLHGSLRIVTGWIGQQHPHHYQVRTPVATIGVRGTDHEPLYIPPEEATEEQPAGTYDHVVEGATVIDNSQGQVEISAENTGFVPPLGLPRLLPQLPVFFPKGKFDERINNIKAVLKLHIQEKLQLLEQQHLKLEQKHLQIKEEIQCHQPVLPKLLGLSDLPGQ